MQNIILITSFVLLFFHTDAQKKALGRPEVFEHPYDYSPDNTKMDNYVAKSNLVNKNKSIAWSVISDRDNNHVYDKPGGRSKGTVNFRDFFYVTAETDDFLEIVEASGVESNLKLVNIKRKVGWIPKTNLLLWNTCILDPISKISRKVLLFNRISDIRNRLSLNDGENIPIYNNPDSEIRIEVGKKQIICFVIKVDAKRKRSLISSEENISPLNTDKIIGWVENRRCTNWNTRICLEPNSSQEAIWERENNPDLRIKIFSDDAVVRTFISEKNKNTSNNLIFSEKKILNINSRQRIRFPILELLRDDIFQIIVFPITKFEQTITTIESNDSIIYANDSNPFGSTNSPSFSNYVSDIVNGSIHDKKITPNGANLNSLAEGYTPKKLPNSKYTLYKYVLFMSQNDIREYKRIISKGIVSTTTYDKKRELLFEIYKEIIVQFAGEKRLREKKAEDWTREEMLELVQGIHMKGFQINGIGLDIRIADIKDVKKISNQVIDELLLRFKEIDEKLSSILRLDNKYEYTYSPDQQNVYYWIEMSDLTF
jgi:hypothetical protein